MTKELIIAAFSLQACTLLRRVLKEAGLETAHLCRSGAAALGLCSQISAGLIICHKIQDMSAITLARAAPSHIDVLLLLPSGQRALDSMSNVLSMSLPLDRPEFLRTVHQMLNSSGQRARQSHLRSNEDAALIAAAKRLLLERDNMPEWAAHRFLQQKAMREGKTLAEIAKRITQSVASEV